VAFKDPKETTEAGIDVGVTKTGLTIDKMMVSGFLAGAYIAFGGLVAISVSSGLDPKVWGTLPTLFTGAVFALAIFFPIMAFVAMGFDHVVANMFFIPAAIFAHVPGIDWGGALNNWLFAFLGNLVGAGLFVAGSYYYLYGRGQDDAADQGAGDTERTGFTGNGERVSGEPTTARERSGAERAARGSGA
jgi:formate/nitrite transporter FocA (FNT family)